MAIEPQCQVCSLQSCSKPQLYPPTTHHSGDRSFLLAAQGAQKNVEWTLSVIPVPAPTMCTRARGADMVRIVNPPTLHVTLYNTGNVRLLSRLTTHTYEHTLQHTLRKTTVHTYTDE